MIIETRSPEETFQVGKSLGEKAYPGQVITLTGDLGVGKTVFTQGLAKGLGIEEPVNSPTFTIVQVYEGGRLPFYHFDVYRIGDVEEMDEVGFDEYVSGEGVSLIEWANLIEEILPENRVNITIEKDLEQGFDFRRITAFAGSVMTGVNKCGIPLYMENSSIFGSIRINLHSSGVMRYNKERIIALTPTDLPEPVVPATNKCGILAKSA